MKPGQPGAGQGGGKGNFVICEICDGYIKDLEQLRNHMQWIHKVAQAELVPCQQLINLFFLSGENPPEDDLQSPTVELSEVPVPVFH